MNNQEFKTRTKIRDANNNEPVFYPYSIKVNKCSGSYDNINDPYPKCQSIQFDVKNQLNKTYNVA